MDGSRRLALAEGALPVFGTASELQSCWRALQSPHWHTDLLAFPPTDRLQSMEASDQGATDTSADWRQGRGKRSSLCELGQARQGMSPRR
ncbi:hypothetical protein E6O75_ATG04908 [Venturia nashicola]|uniref:Uncharacterized protein n=1 Tax=Venturia nashicola TaxID=86259 RepID=A0A4Z1P285_9PEZI|nr:hypothetical protein E6O75_ATG04908 [Venturia nashicola]